MVFESTYEARAGGLYGASGSDWVIVYGDKEHSANLAFVCGFDPRFEEAILVLGPSGKRVLVLGNEGVGYSSKCRLRADVALCQSFSLMGQSRKSAPRLVDVLVGIGIVAGESIGIVGWKYFEADECEEPTHPAFVPAFLVNAARQAVGVGGQVKDVTPVVMHPARGLKSFNSADQIAEFEWSASRASRAVNRVLRGVKPGMSEFESVVLSAYEGDPLTCHMMFASAGSDEPVVGLRSPSSRMLSAGDGVTTALGFQGGLTARAGLLNETIDESFLNTYVKPYYCAIAGWWETIRIGVSGGDVHNAVMNALAGAPFTSALNPGHLTSIDEWTHTPICAGGVLALGSGMILQCDIIPSPMPHGQALNCEDTVAIGDANLRASLSANYPELWRRIQLRRQFMRDAHGIMLADEVLPLSSTPAYLVPFWLARDLVCTVSR